MKLEKSADWRRTGLDSVYQPCDAGQVIKPLLRTFIICKLEITMPALKNHYYIYS